jgi:spoIIIJ-associated protein
MNHSGNQQKQKVTTQGKTLELAVVKAAVALGVDQDQVGYEVVKESKGGIMKLFGFGQVEISAWVKGGGHGRRGGRGRGRGRGGDEQQRAGASSRGEPSHHRHGGRDKGRPDGRENSRHSGRRDRSNGRGEREELYAQRQARSEPRPPREPAEPLDPAQQEQVVQELRTFCAEVCSRIVGKPVEVTATLNDDRLRMDIKDEEIGSILSQNSKLAESLEHLLRKKPRHLKQELPFRVFIDAGNSRRSREEELTTLAREMSEKVVETQRPVVLNYQSSYDRKIIHTTLEGDERVFTKSIGSGSNRKLMILPARDKNQSDAEQA